MNIQSTPLYEVSPDDGFRHSNSINKINHKKLPKTGDSNSMRDGVDGTNHILVSWIPFIIYKMR